MTPAPAAALASADILLLIPPLALALVLAVSGVAKLGRWSATRESARHLGVPEALQGAVAIALPFVEIGLAAALLLLPGALYAVAVAATLLLFLGFTVAVALAVNRGESFSCECFGALSRGAVVSADTVRRNAALVVLAGVAFAAAAGPAPIARLAGLGGFDYVVLLLGLVALFAGGAWLLRAISGKGVPARLVPAAPAGGGAATGGASAARPGGEQTAQVLAEVEAFALPLDHVPVTDAQGKPAMLASYVRAGSPTLLVFAKSGCAPCSQVMNRMLTEWESQLAGHARVLYIDAGGPKALGQAYPALRGRRHVGAGGAARLAFDVRIAPAVVLIAADGKTVRVPAVYGPSDIAALITGVLRDGEPAAGA